MKTFRFVIILSILKFTEALDESIFDLWNFSLEINQSKNSHNNIDSFFKLWTILTKIKCTFRQFNIEHIWKATGKPIKLSYSSVKKNSTELINWTQSFKKKKNYIPTRVFGIIFKSNFIFVFFFFFWFKVAEL